jgi:periplasmic divalent cation tolerance protein
MKPLLVTTNLPDQASAQTLARALVERRLAACVNILPACQSIYHWQGAIEEASEVPLLIKTTADRLDAVKAAFGEFHPYDVPELVALELHDGLPAYLDWVIAETRPAA